MGRVGTEDHSRPHGRRPRVRRRHRPAVGSNVADFHPGDSSAAKATSSAAAAAIASPAAATCAHDTKGVGVNRPGAFAEFLSLPMTNVWHHHRGHRPRRRRHLRPLRQRRAHRALLPRARRRRAHHRRRPHRHHGRRGRPPRRRALRRDHRPQPYRLDLAEKMGVTLRRQCARAKNSPTCRSELGMSEGFDVGLEMSGNAAAFSDMLANMGHGGRIAMLGIPSRRHRHRLEHRRSSTCSPSRASTAAKCTRPGTR